MKQMTMEIHTMSFIGKPFLYIFGLTLFKEETYLT